jgi:hypothetical protein
MPAAVDGVPQATLAMPKSVIFTWPSPVISRLAGLISRCTSPAECAACRPSPACAIRSMVWPGFSGPAARISASEGPSTNSITRNGKSAEPSSPKSYTWATPGWDSREAWRASARNLTRASGSPAASGRSSLTATFRSSSRSKARHTWPVAPEATSSSRRYRPASGPPWPATDVIAARTPAGMVKMAAGTCQPADPGPPGEDEASRCSDHKRQLPNPRIARRSRSAARALSGPRCDCPTFLPGTGCRL